MLESLRRPPRRRGLVAVVSDFLGTAPATGDRCRGSVRCARSRDRHQLLGIEVLDPRELELPAAGLVTFVDPESGRELEVQTSSTDACAGTTPPPRRRSAPHRDRAAPCRRRAPATAHRP